MKLYVEPMDVVVVEVDSSGRVRYEHDEAGRGPGEPGEPGDEDGWSEPSLQEKRAIIYAARQELAALVELVEVLEGKSGRTH